MSDVTALICTALVVMGLRGPLRFAGAVLALIATDIRRLRELAERGRR